MKGALGVVSMVGVGVGNFGGVEWRFRWREVLGSGSGVMVERELEECLFEDLLRLGMLGLCLF